MVKNPSASAGDIREVGSILESGRSPGGGHGHPLQYSCLENPMDREAWWATVHRIAKSWTRLIQLSMHMYLQKDVHFVSIHSNQVSQTELIHVLTPRSRELPASSETPLEVPSTGKSFKERRK